jgi:hypothetical protein
VDVALAGFREQVCSRLLRRADESPTTKNDAPTQAANFKLPSMMPYLRCGFGCEATGFVVALSGQEISPAVAAANAPGSTHRTSLAVRPALGPACLASKLRS